MTKQTRANCMLFIITVFWGASYILTKLGLGTLAPFNLTALRFVIAFCVSALVFHKNIRRADLKTVKYSIFLAVILLCVFITMTYGLQYTSASNAGFLVSLSVVFVPVLSFLALRQKIENRVIVSICFAMIGIAMLTLNTQLTIGGGDLLCILCALLFAAHIVATGVLTKKVDSIALGVLQLGFVGLFSTILSLSMETMALPATPLSWFVVLSLSILCTAIGYIVQTTAQQYTSATHTGLILALEPVFSAIFAAIFLSELLSIRAYAGAVILLISVVGAELNVPSILARRSENTKPIEQQK